MIVGDLVMLSSYARRLKGWYNGRENDVGIVVSKKWGSLFSVRWCSDNKLQINVDRRDLIYAKNKDRRPSNS